MSRLIRAAALTAAVAAVVPTLSAVATPPPPRPLCSLHFRDRTISNDQGLPDVTYPEPYWVC